jgi:TonB dependent receptor.
VHWQPLERLVLDAAYTYTRTRFSGAQPGDGNYIAESPSSTAAAGITYSDPQGFDGELKFRYFGRRPLTDDGSILSHTTKVVNLGGGYHVTPKLRVGIQLLNLFDSHDHDIDYYYASRLSTSEPVDGINDNEFHPVQPFQVRATVSYVW